MNEIHEIIGGYRDIVVTTNKLPPNAVCINVGHPCPCGQGAVIDPNGATVLGVERSDWMQCGSWTTGERNRPHRRPKEWFLYCTEWVAPNEFRINVVHSRLPEGTACPGCGQRSRLPSCRNCPEEATWHTGYPTPTDDPGP